jgi:hypothetical protein
MGWDAPMREVGLKADLMHDQGEDVTTLRNAEDSLIDDEMLIVGLVGCGDLCVYDTVVP